MKRGIDVFGRLVGLGILLAIFLFSMGSVVFMSLQGAEVRVPEITGKDLSAGEEVLASLGLKLKKRADRFSEEAPNTIIEQLPKPGETVKTGQLILVVTSKGPGEGMLPKALQKSDEDDSEKIEEMISDKPKRQRTNTNSNRKKADPARDTAGNSNRANEPDEKKPDAEGPTDKPANKKEPTPAASPGERPAPRNAGNTKQPNVVPQRQPADRADRPVPRPR
jgi:hypothetical protein